uniref:Serine/threonine-protein phosphatase 2A activator n=1 Tax=Pyrodinium bahamense TaxID=73915 RepID=A0A7S0AAZ4_9DINO
MAAAPAAADCDGERPHAAGMGTPEPNGTASATTVAQERAREIEQVVPRKRINSPEDLEVFKQSRLCEQLLSFASELSEAIKGQPCSPERLPHASPLVRSLVELLKTLEGWVDELPPLAQPMRFGNRAFRQWHARLVERGEGLLVQALGSAPAAVSAGAAPLAAELARYLADAFGDERRIDYGTGHEASFLAFLFALGARGALAKADAADAVLLVFNAYLRVVRRLQEAYVLEPAGSHGVWGLDDFHALPFLFGAAQLVGMEEEVPTGEVYRERIVKDYADHYLYVGAIRQVLLAKRGAPFHETSPMLYDISAVPTWQKTHAGLVRMYRAEVLGKYPVIQHFLFGPTLPWPGDAGSAA